MALDDPYADVAAYKAAVGKTGTDEDTAILAVVKAVSRLFDRECERFFGQDAAVVTRVYDGNGQDLLYVDDIATATGLVVKVDLNADYDFADANETLTKDSHFWIGPANALLEPEAQPYRYLQVRPGNAVFSIWPDQAHSVEVTAKFGWPAVPGAIREATILVAREIRDLQKAGPTAMIQNVEDVVRLSPTAFAIVQRIKREYGRASLFA
jgi:hypothetical protein